MTATTNCVCVWLDTHAEPGNPAWIVSRDRIDDAGRSETNTTLLVFEEDEEDEAEEAALELGRELRLPVYYNPERGHAVRIADAPGEDD